MLNKRKLTIITLVLGAFIMTASVVFSRACMCIPKAPVRVTVRFGDPAVFDDNLWITLTKTDGYGSQVKIFATITSPDYDKAEIPGEGIGYKISYRGRCKYDIQILDTSEIKSDFLIARKPG